MEPETPPVAAPQNQNTQSQTPNTQDTTNTTAPTPTTTVAAQTQNTQTPPNIATTARNTNTQDNTVHSSQLTFYEHATAVKQNPTQGQPRTPNELGRMSPNTTNTHTIQRNTDILLSINQFISSHTTDIHNLQNQSNENIHIMCNG